jgi:uncharacterized membrane protein
MGIGMIVVLVAVVLLVVYLVRATTAQQTQAQTRPPAYIVPPPAPQTAEQRVVESARDIVQRRYASGEIEREEYLQKLADL